MLLLTRLKKNKYGLIYRIKLYLYCTVCVRVLHLYDILSHHISRKVRGSDLNFFVSVDVTAIIDVFRDNSFQNRSKLYAYICAPGSPGNGAPIYKKICPLNVKL